MRRRDREITDPAAILAIVDECEVLRLGLADGDYPYIVPVNFAYRMEDGVLCFYIHGAMAGRKYMLLSENPVCSFEMDVPLGIECIPEKGDATMRYRSVMGKASVTFLDGEAVRTKRKRLRMQGSDSPVYAAFFPIIPQRSRRP